MRSVILIASEGFDSTTDVVCQWLYHYGHLFIRVNREDECRVVEIKIGKTMDLLIEVNGLYCFRLSQVKSFWYRRGGLTSITRN